MDTHDALTTRRTIHSFVEGVPLPDEVLQRALHAAHMAPCHQMTWPWRFRILGPATRAQLVEVAVDLQRSKGKDEAVCRPVMTRKIAGPSSLVVVTQRKVDDPFRAQEDYAACACAVQNLMLSLHADGWGTKWGTGALTRLPAALEVLGIDPVDEDMVGWIYVGKPVTVPSIDRPDPETAIERLP